MFSKVCSSARVPTVRGHVYSARSERDSVCRLERCAENLVGVYYVFIMISVWLDVSNYYSSQSPAIDSSGSRHGITHPTDTRWPLALRYYAVRSARAGGVSVRVVARETRVSRARVASRHVRRGSWYRVSTIIFRLILPAG